MNRKAGHMHRTNWIGAVLFLAAFGLGIGSLAYYIAAETPRVEVGQGFYAYKVVPPWRIVSMFASPTVSELEAGIHDIKGNAQVFQIPLDNVVPLEFTVTIEPGFFSSLWPFGEKKKPVKITGKLDVSLTHKQVADLVTKKADGTPEDLFLQPVQKSVEDNAKSATEKIKLQEAIWKSIGSRMNESFNIKVAGVTIDNIEPLEGEEKVSRISGLTTVLKPLKTVPMSVYIWYLVGTTVVAGFILLLLGGVFMPGLVAVTGAFGEIVAWPLQLAGWDLGPSFDFSLPDIDISLPDIDFG